MSGIDKNSGEGKFLRNMAIADITTDYYRGLTGEDGLECTQALMNRDPRFQEIPVSDPNDEIKHVQTPSGTETVIAAAGSGRLTGVITEIFIPAGTHFWISSPHGIQGTIKARECVNRKPVKATYVAKKDV